MRKNYPLISVVTPAYRADFVIGDFIKSLQKIQYPNIEFFLCFDPSPDKGVAIARKLTRGKKNWHIIVNKNHLGISKALNLGIQKSHGEYIIFLMTDQLVDKMCITNLLDYLKGSKDKRLGAVTAKTLDIHKPDRIQAYRMYLVPQTGYLYIPEYGAKDCNKYDKPYQGYSGIDGTLFKREVFVKAGMFDDDIDLSVNDLDMTWRTWLAGYKIVRLPKARIYHWSLKEGRGDLKWEFTYDKMLNLFIQNYSLKYLLLYLPQLITIYSGRAIMSFMLGNPDPLRGWLKCLRWSIWYFPKALKKRQFIQSQVRRVSDEYLHTKIFKRMSFWDFYKHIRWVQQNITPIMLTEAAKDERILTYTK